MAVLFFDPVRQYGTDEANIERHWTQRFGTSGLTVDAAYTTLGPALRFDNGASPIEKTVVVGGTANKGWACFRWKHNVNNAAGGFAGLHSYSVHANNPLIDPTSSGSSLDTYLNVMCYVRLLGRTQFCLSLERNGRIRVIRGGASEFSEITSSHLVETTANALSEGALHFIALDWTIDASAGALKITVDGDVWEDWTSLNLRSLDTTHVDAEWDSVCVGRPRGYPGGVTEDFSWDYRDLLIGDDDTSDQDNDWDAAPLPFVMDLDYPTADGTHTDFTPSSGSDHFAMVDDVTPDDDATTIDGTTAGDKDSFTHAGPPFAGVDLIAAGVLALVKAKGGGSSATRVGFRIGSTDYPISPSKGNAGDFLYQGGFVNNKPSDHAPFSEAEFTAAEPYVEKTL